MTFTETAGPEDGFTLDDLEDAAAAVPEPSSVPVPGIRRNPSRSVQKAETKQGGTNTSSPRNIRRSAHQPVQQRQQT